MLKTPVLKLTTDTEKKTRTAVDTVMITPTILGTWKSPPFQRPVRENEKVRALAEELKRNGGVWPGIVTLGVLAGDVYVIDGQHRRAAFLIAQLSEGYTDIRTHYFASMAEMGEEFVRLNSQLVRMKPDDILRGLEASTASIQYIRKQCPFVGYDYIRRGPKTPLVSMSLVMRAWRGSSSEVPSFNGAGTSSATIATCLDEQEYHDLADYLLIAIAAWGRDSEYYRLWGGLNNIMCMWLYRRLVITQYSSKSPRLSKEMFRKCMTSLTAAPAYLDWLTGRTLSDRDRVPGYNRVKTSFAARLLVETGKKTMLPQPSWAHT